MRSHLTSDRTPDYADGLIWLSEKALNDLPFTDNSMKLHPEPLGANEGV